MPLCLLRLMGLPQVLHLNIDRSMVNSRVLHNPHPIPCRNVSLHCHPNCLQVEIHVPSVQTQNVKQFLRQEGIALLETAELPQQQGVAAPSAPSVQTPPSDVAAEVRNGRAALGRAPPPVSISAANRAAGLPMDPDEDLLVETEGALQPLQPGDILEQQPRRQQRIVSDALAGAEYSGREVAMWARCHTCDLGLRTVQRHDADLSMSDSLAKA